MKSLARVTFDPDQPKLVIEGLLDQRQKTLLMRQTLVGDKDIYEEVRDMKAQGKLVRVTIEVLNNECGS